MGTLYVIISATSGHTQPVLLYISSVFLIVRVDILLPFAISMVGLDPYLLYDQVALFASSVVPADSLIAARSPHQKTSSVSRTIAGRAPDRSGGVR